MKTTSRAVVLVLLVTSHGLLGAAAARANTITNNAPTNTITAKDFAAAIEQLLPALQDLALSAAQGSTDNTAATQQGRKLQATTTTAPTTQQLKTSSRVNLLASDAFSMVYTGGLWRPDHHARQDLAAGHLC